ncbi:MAG: HlyC/CorC family transporter [Erysipelotrichales bacterium]|nr:HlyC/CorC family transporter [Erysipelotrichales bacterium]
MIFYYIALPILILLSGFFSMSEIALNSANVLKLKKASENGDKMAKRALNIIESINESVYSILFGNDFVNIFSTSIATIVGNKLFENLQNNSYSNLLVSAIMFMIILTFGEVLPKTIGLKFNYQISRLVSLPLKILIIILKPIIFVINKIVNLIAKPFIKKNKEEEIITDDELIEMVETIEEEGVINEKQGDLLKSAIEFTDTTVYEIMTPRVNIFALDINEDNDKVYKTPKFATYSRVPIYEDTIDNIIGVITVKQVLKLCLKGEKIDLKSIMREPIYVHKSKQISSMLKDFKDTKNHIAVIIDEFGGTEGIVTMEDIVEELVGEIWDETDEIEEDYQQKGENTYIVDGSMNIDDFFNLVDIDEEIESDYTTIGGFCIEQLERFAQVGDTFDFKNLIIEILEVDEFTVEKVKVVVNKDEEENDN